MRPYLERTKKLTLLSYIAALFRRNHARAQIQTAQEILEALIPSRPQVAAHQRSAALHIQLANEIGWEPRRAPASWRGQSHWLGRRASQSMSLSKGSR